MPKNQYEEKKKDEICQAIYDTLEAEGWGADIPRLNLEIIFTGKLRYELRVTKSLTKSLRRE
jgi:hypothetical protein